jgi:hypothetical protein
VKHHSDDTVTPGAVLFCDLLLNFNTPRAFSHRTEATIHRQAVQRSYVATLAPLTGTALSLSFANTSLLVRFLADPPLPYALLLALPRALSTYTPAMHLAHDE